MHSYVSLLLAITILQDDPHEVTDNGVQHITVPTITVPSDDDHTSDEAVKSKNHPSVCS